MSDHKKPSRIGLIITLLAAVIITIVMSCTFQVRSNQASLLTTFGKIGDEVYEPGLHWKSPWPFQKVLTLDRSMQLFQGKYEENLMADQRTLILTIFAVWRIKEPVAFATQGLDAERVRQLIADTIRSVKGDVLAKHPVEHLVSADKGKRQFEAIETEIRDKVAAHLSEKGYGLEVVSLGIERIALPEKVTSDVFTRMAKERRNKAERKLNEGRLQAGKIRAEGRKKRGQVEADAREKAKLIRSGGDLAAAAEYRKFDKDREFAIFLRELESLEQLMSKETTLIIDRESRPFSLLKGDFLNEKKK
jgi:membrane protease subunit HflC